MKWKNLQEFCSYAADFQDICSTSADILQVFCLQNNSIQFTDNTTLPRKISYFDKARESAGVLQLCRRSSGHLQDSCRCPAGYLQECRKMTKKAIWLLGGVPGCHLDGICRSLWEGSGHWPVPQSDRCSAMLWTPLTISLSVQHCWNTNLK